MTSKMAKLQGYSLGLLVTAPVWPVFLVNVSIYIYAVIALTYLFTCLWRLPSVRISRTHLIAYVCAFSSLFFLCFEPMFGLVEHDVMTSFIFIFIAVIFYLTSSFFPYEVLLVKFKDAVLTVSFILSILIIIGQLIDGDYRIFWTADNYLAVGLVLGFSFSLLANDLFCRNVGLIKKLMICVVFLGVVFSLSRGTLMFASLILIVNFISYSSNLRAYSYYKALAGKFFIPFILLPLIFALSIMLLPERTVDRLVGITDMNQEGTGVGIRMVIWKNWWQEFLRAPIFGHGLGYSLIDPALHPHNLFLQVAVDGGCVSLIFFSGFLLLPIYVYYKGLSNEHTSRDKDLKGLFFGYIYLLLEYTRSYDVYTGRAVFVLAGLLLAFSIFYKKSSPNSHREKIN
ncbi:O-antigen ligase family protein [Pseudoalteromonas sp. S16_S37]|uniref:O-antigen ligase family protein n=1 Tax=Pseudoalteromonas sp. S16_S37 TaxID=2720228 RepID=UPI0016814F11|nr:O-antigen ligase family protein [Pseudoalteromonas sp. S16_S37]MBD1580938.1 O-antigen ligase family protein [Pseudoalteromonas sp. S16_S37]